MLQQFFSRPVLCIVIFTPNVVFAKAVMNGARFHLYAEYLPLLNPLLFHVLTMNHAGSRGEAGRASAKILF